MRWNVKQITLVDHEKILSRGALPNLSLFSPRHTNSETSALRHGLTAVAYFFMHRDVGAADLSKDHA